MLAPDSSFARSGEYASETHVSSCFAEVLLGSEQLPGWAVDEMTFASTA